jgi:fatty acid desaturase
MDHWKILYALAMNAVGVTGAVILALYDHPWIAVGVLIVTCTWVTEKKDAK